MERGGERREVERRVRSGERRRRERRGSATGGEADETVQGSLQEECNPELSRCGARFFLISLSAMQN
eukprot:766518-Hanusia_phi.AAC.1